jgi:predicted AAA+ superfamily ATPase
MLSSAESSTEVELPPNSTFSLIPTQDKKAREVWYIAGPSGSGKSYIAKGLAQAYHDYFPDRPIYLVSKLSEDSTLDKLKFLERLDPQKLVEDPISDLDMLKDSMIIFDDVDTFDKETDKVIQKLIDDIATMGKFCPCVC